MVVREGGIVNLFASSLFLGTDLKLWMNIFKEGGRFLTRECDSDIIVSRWVWMNLSKSVTKQTNRKSCIGINFCQLSHKSQEIGHYYRSPCGLQLIGNYRHLNMFLQSSSTFACLIHISASFPVFIYIYQNKYEQVYNVSVCRGTTYSIFLFWMYTIKIHFPCLTICMLSYESQRRGLYLLFTIRWQHSRQNVVRIENGGKMGLNPRAYPSRVQTQICTQKNLPQPLSIQIMKRKKKKEGKVWMDTVQMAPRLHFSVADFRVDSFLLF